jgi:hypothetical protein
MKNIFEGKRGRHVRCRGALLALFATTLAAGGCGPSRTKGEDAGNAPQVAVVKVTRHDMASHLMYQRRAESPASAAIEEAQS